LDLLKGSQKKTYSLYFTVDSPNGGIFRWENKQSPRHKERLAVDHGRPRQHLAKRSETTSEKCGLKWFNQGKSVYMFSVCSWDLYGFIVDL
jgi:hypothetical protein